MDAVARGPRTRTLRMSVGVILLGAVAACGAGVTLRNDVWSVELDPATLAVTATPAGAQAVPVSAGQGDLGKVDQVKSGDSSAGWAYADKGVDVAAKLEGDTLTVHFAAGKAGKFTWPVLPGKSPATAYVLPFFEGFYVPTDDADWVKYLVEHSPMDTTADLSMPFWGVQTPGHTLTYLLPNAFGNELSFRDEGGRAGATFTHTFRANWKVKEYEVRVSLGAESPIEPARRYRQYLIDTKQFVSLKDKIAKTPEAGKLLGAPHVYLWGSDVIARDDIRDYKALAKEILRQSQSDGPSPGKHLWSLMGDEAKKVLTDLPGAEWVDSYMKGVVTSELTQLMARPDFYEAASWPGIAVPEGSGIGRNCRLLAAAYAKYLNPVETWGDGYSVKMIQRLRDAGLDRLRIVSPDSVSLRNNPGAVVAAKSAGYLIGPYDSYDGIHRPGEANSWETSQFDQHLYDTGGITKQDGKPMRGFQQKGKMLSPIAARPYVEQRVGAWMKDFPANVWFMDCDAFGQWYDDFSPLHPATQADDLRERLARMDWIRDTYHCVMGSEGGSSLAAEALHFAEGPETPAMGWGDPDLQKDKTSPYYLGSYYPPNGPAVFFKPVPLKPSYKKFTFDPQYRVPLYQVALHDSLIATHHWSFGSFKLSDQVQVREMLELLYGVPPMYHLNPEEFAKRKDAIMTHYAFFSPLHRETALLPMTDFAYLTADRMVQRTRFGDAMEVVANFSEEAYEHGGRKVPARSVVAVDLRSGDIKEYRPSAP